MALVLLFSVFIISTCGLIYELISGTLASYLLGDSITQFSTIIGVYLFSMGVGSYLSKFIENKLIQTFIYVELLIGMLGGTSALILFMSFEHVSHFKILLYAMVFLIGSCVGLEIPLMMRILKTHLTDFKDLVSKVFTFDYIGALLASLIFPLILVPHLGLIRSAFLFGIVNVLVGVVAIHAFKSKLPQPGKLYTRAIACIVLLGIGMLFSNTLTRFSESYAYEGKIIYSKSTPYQRIVLSRNGNDIRMYLNANLQFSAKDEYRYHEALVHVGLAQLQSPSHVLVLGGGDGMAVREILKYPTIQQITLVDLDPHITHLFKSMPFLTALNHKALQSEKVTIVNQDAFLWLKSNTQQFDFIVVDFPDPSNFSVGKLYTTTFYRYLHNALKNEGIAAIQSTSPVVATRSFWCIANTLEHSRFFVKPYLSYVPSFGMWGFQLASKSPLHTTHYHLPPGLRYLSLANIESLFVIPPDLAKVQTEINALTNQILVNYFEEEWRRYV